MRGRAVPGYLARGRVDRSHVAEKCHGHLAREDKIDKFLEHYGMKPWFGFIFAKEDSGSKPDKLDRAMRSMNYGKRDTVYIGDARSDVESAKTAGVPSIAVTWVNQHTDIPRKSDPTYLVSKPANIIAIIESLKRGKRTASAA